MSRKRIKLSTEGEPKVYSLADHHRRRLAFKPTDDNLARDDGSNEEKDQARDYERFFSEALTKIKENKDAVILDLFNCEIEFERLDEGYLRFFFNKMIAKEFKVASNNLLFFDDVNEDYFFNLVEEKKAAKAQGVKMDPDAKIQLDYLQRIYDKFFADNKKSAIEIAANIVQAFSVDRPQFEIEEMQKWIDRLPAILFILENGLDRFKEHPKTLKEFKNFTKNAFSQEEQVRLLEEKSEIEVMKSGIEMRIRDKQKPSSAASTATATQTSETPSQETQIS